MVNDPSLFLSFLEGTLLPLLIAFILAQLAPQWLKALVTFGICLAFTALSMWLSNKITGPSPGLSTNDTLKLWVENAGLILMAAWTTYQHFWKPTGITPAINNVGPQLGAGMPPVPPPAP